jgi:8-oxo-dGTP pyrophosphatase MutT (NUDIX family)
VIQYPPRGFIAIAGVIPVRRNTNGERVVLIQRRSNGKLGLIGGHHESGETLQETAFRECYEECGRTPVESDVITSVEGQSDTHYSMNFVIDASEWSLRWKNNGTSTHEVSSFNLTDAIDATYGHGWITLEIFETLCNNKSIPFSMKVALRKVFNMN